MAAAAESTAEAFNERINQISEGAHLLLSMRMGHRLGLFNTIQQLGATAGDSSGKTSQQIADKAGYRERYVREWLNNMVVGDIVECDPTASRYWIPAHRFPTLAYNNGQSSAALGHAYQLPMLYETSVEVEKCFKLDGPTGTEYEIYGTEFHDTISAFHEQEHQQHLVQDVFPTVPGLVQRLQTGIRVLDIGCGTGFTTYLAAKHFPNSTFVGLDYSASIIKRATERFVDGDSMPNLSYIQMDATEMRDDWTGTFDYAIAFDCIHDLPYPDKCLAEIRRILKPDEGIFSMYDIRSTSNALEDRKAFKAKTPGTNTAPVACFTWSLVHCMPVASLAPEGEGLGNMWGKQVAERMLRKAGFQTVQETPMEWAENNVHYVCTV